MTDIRRTLLWGIFLASLFFIWEAWNRREDDDRESGAGVGFAEAWAGFVSRREALDAHADAWCRQLAARRDLVDQLVDFADNVLK